ncbi:MAG: alpha/beta hydrolase [Leptospiraceae bacterium]|nr:alpha/beta hydrolase [Leptospiraceae bacterium]
MIQLIFSLLILFLVQCSFFPGETTNVKVNLGDELNTRIKESYDVPKDVKVYFATNRLTTSNTPGCSNNYYTTKLDSETRFGNCTINVPPIREIGDIEVIGTDIEKQFVFRDHKNLPKETLLSQIKDNSFPEVILFVHGFNVKFEEAVLRASQIKYDLKFPGEVLLFTWPSGAEEGILSNVLMNQTYKNNFTSAKGSVGAFKQILSGLKSTGKKIHLIVHSMGHQVALNAVGEFQVETKEKKFIQEMILNAPDFESLEFALLIPKLRDASERITVYCSPGDTALIVSAKVNSNKRVGSCENLRDADVDVINVNEIDTSILGHGYYASRPIITDLYQLILGVKVERRLFIRKASNNNSEKYVLRK